MRHQKVGELLGISLTSKENVGYLTGLELEAIQISEEAATFRIPTWRVDLKRETDLIEEVCRLHGVDKIPATQPRGVVGENAFDPVHDDLAEARSILTGLGLNEAQGQTLIDGETAKLVTEKAISLEHPLSSEMDMILTDKSSSLVES